MTELLCFWKGEPVFKDAPREKLIEILGYFFAEKDRERRVINKEVDKSMKKK